MVAGGLLERGALGPGQEPPVRLAALEEEAGRVRVVVVPFEEAGHGLPRHAEQDAREVGEGLVPVLGQRPPGLVPRPQVAPLEAVAVPVAEEEVEQPGAEVRRHVDVHVARGPVPPELLRGDDLVRAEESAVAIRSRQRVLVDRPRLAAEGRAELAQRGIVGHEDDLGIRVDDAGRLGQRRDHERRAGVVGHRLVLEDPGRPALAPLLGQDLGRVLVQRPEGVAAPVRAFQGEAQALHAAHLPHGREAAGVGAQVEHRHLDRRRPHRAVGLAEPELVEAPRGVFGAAGDGLACLRGRGGNGGQGKGGGEQCHVERSAAGNDGTSDCGDHGLGARPYRGSKANRRDGKGL